MKVRIAAAAMDMGRVELNHIPSTSAVINAASMRGVKRLPCPFGALLLPGEFHRRGPLPVVRSASPTPR